MAKKAEKAAVAEEKSEAVVAEKTVKKARPSAAGKAEKAARADKADKKLKITLLRSKIGQKPKARATVEAMGFRKIGQTVELPDNSSTRGQIQRIRHMVRVEE